MAGKSRTTFAAWFALTREERWLVAGVVGLALLGLTARYLHLRQLQPEPVTAPVVNAPALQGAQE